MKLRINHITDYRYFSPVHGSSNDLRLTPPQTRWQKTVFFLLKIIPSSRLHRFQDLYTNHVTHFEIEEPHHNLLIESNLTIITTDAYTDGLPLGVPSDELAALKNVEELQPFLHDNGVVEIPPEIWRIAIDIASNETDVFSLAQALMRYVHETCQYVPGVTSVSTTSTQFFADKRGVCQDFAHLMIALCRALRLPARYVSGYLYDAKRKDIRGAHSTHAWVDVWVPNRGWYGLDPTNNCLTKETYVTLAVGRDYHDAAPITGSYWGSTGCEMVVKVHIEEV
ncbi:MAG: transglutaminase family protein [Verrucomicrobiota bacterium]